MGFLLIVTSATPKRVLSASAHSPIRSIYPDLGQQHLNFQHWAYNVHHSFASAGENLQALPYQGYYRPLHLANLTRKASRGSGSSDQASASLHHALTISRLLMSTILSAIGPRHRTFQARLRPK
jgi:hypothetical protein